MNSSQQIAWPSKPLFVESGDILLVYRNRPILRLNLHGHIPPINDSYLSSVFNIGFLPGTVTTSLSSTDYSDIIPNTQLLISSISHSFLSHLPSSATQTLIESLSNVHMILDSCSHQYDPVDDISSGRVNDNLLHLLETETDSAPTNNSFDDSILRCLAQHDDNLGTRLYPLKSQITDPRMRILLTLEKNSFIGREVVISATDLKADCGTLLAFDDSDCSSCFLLTPTGSSYQIYDPRVQLSLSTDSPDGKLHLEKLSQRMYVVYKAFDNSNMSPLGLLRYAYGEPSNTTAFTLGGLLLGISIGFILSIGNEVGAARWIFGIGITGMLLGITIGFLTKGFRLAVIFMFISTCLSLLTPSFNTIITNDALPDRDLSLLLQLSLILVAAGILRISFEWMQTRSILYSQQKGSAKSDLAGIYRILQLPIEFFRNRSVGDLQLRISYLSELREEIRDLFEGGLIKSVLTSIYILFMLKISVKLTLLAVVISACIAIPSCIIAVQSRPLLRKKQEVEAIAQAKNLELISSVSKLRIAGAESSAAKWWAQDYKRVVNLETALDIKEAISSLLQSVLPNVATLLLYIVITKMIAESSQTSVAPLNVGSLLGFFSASATFIGSVASLSGLIVGALEIPVIYERAKPILDEPLEALPEQDEIVDFQGSLKFDRVSYRYEPSLPLVLDNLSFELPAGGYLALVGPSGSGKSTVVRLLLGFAQPEQGSISYDGRAFSSLKPESVRRNIGAVLQASSLFSGSLMEAIAGGAIISEKEVWDAAEMVGLADDIKQMPMGLQTVIPDGGGTLSGGQCQRVAIARALARRPKLLIFDEATSALDNKTQAVVSQTLDKLNVTRIVIAHRLSTIENADQILYLEDGQCKEIGSYDSLLNLKGRFYSLVQRQLT